MSQAYPHVCPTCDWVCEVPNLSAGERARCPRCAHSIACGGPRTHAGTLALSLTGLILLALSVGFDFLSFDVQGRGHTIRLLDAGTVLLDQTYLFLGILVLATTVFLPGLYLAGAFYLSLALARDRPLPGSTTVCRWLAPIEPWMMSDVFIVGILVSLIKIVTLANVMLGPAFYTFCAYAILMLAITSRFHPTDYWHRFVPAGELAARPQAGRTAAAQGCAGCHACGLIFTVSGTQACPRCGHRLPAAAGLRLQRTWALLAAASVLLLPANLMPIMATVSLGYTTPATIIGGVVHMVETGSWPIALVIFVASIVVPIAKIGMLGWLCLKLQTGRPATRLGDLRVYRVTEVIGRWSMIDIFVVAVLTALIQADQYMAVSPGPAAASFAAVVLLTMLAAQSLDPRLIAQRHTPT